MSRGPSIFLQPALAAGTDSPSASSAGARPLSFAPPPLPPRGQREDGLSRGQRQAMVGAILAAHVAAIWGLLQIREVREAVAEAAPIFVSLVKSPEPPKPVPPPPPTVVPKPVPKTPPPPVVIAAAPTPAPAPFVVPAPPPEPVPPVPPPPVPVVAAPAPPAPPPPPKIIPASAVQYLGEPPVPEYPRLSIRANETGRVMLRIWIDEGGLPQKVSVERSSGHPRLDEAGLAVMKKARFKPYTENGQAVAGWAFVPFDFALEK